MDKSSRMRREGFFREEHWKQWRNKSLNIGMGALRMKEPWN